MIFFNKANKDISEQVSKLISARKCEGAFLILQKISISNAQSRSTRYFFNCDRNLSTEKKNSANGKSLARQDHFPGLANKETLATSFWTKGGGDSTQPQEGSKWQLLGKDEGKKLEKTKRKFGNSQHRNRFWSVIKNSHRLSIRGTRWVIPARELLKCF